jgi:hypothetical protein
MTSIVVLLMFWCARVAAAAPTVTVGFLDDARSPIVCTADGSDCVTEFTFRGTTRFYIDVPPAYGVGVELSPVKSGVCKPFNDIYITKPPYSFANNSLAAFKVAQFVGVGMGKDDPNGLVYALMAACNATENKRFYIGVHQLDQGWIGNCQTGRFRLRLGDSSHRCGYRREDRQCYEGKLSCTYTSGDSTARYDFPVGDPVRCCPAKQPGQSDSVTTALSCTCAGLDRAPPAPVPTAAGTCQSGEFCREKCGIAGGISASGISYGSCCADCSASGGVSIVNGRCTNSCPAFGVGPAPASTPAPQWIPQGSPPWQPLTTPQPTSTECDDCDCAQRRCEARCTAESTTVLTFNCLRSGPVFSHMCECQPTRTSDAIFRSQPSAMVISWMLLALAALSHW